MSNVLGLEREDSSPGSGYSQHLDALFNLFDGSPQVEHECEDCLSRLVQETLHFLTAMH